MTEIALKKLEDQLTCSVCLETYKVPKLLQCFHVYCKDCLARIVVKDIQGTCSLSCPTCRQTSAVPSCGVTGLQPAFHINHLLEIRDDLKRAKIPSAVLQVNGKDSVDQGVEDTRHAVFCSFHEGKEMELFCATCSELICLKCAIKGGAHHSHNYSPVVEVLEKAKTDISSWLEPVEDRVQVIGKALEEVDQRRDEISKQHETLEEAMGETVENIHSFVDARKAELISSLRTISDDKLLSLSTQRGNLVTSHTQLKSCLEFVKVGLSKGSPAEILQTKKTVSNLIKDLSSSFGTEVCEPVTKPDTRFEPPSDAQCAVYKTFGSVYAHGVCVVSKSYVSGDGLRSAMVGEDASITVHAVNHLGEPCSEPIKNLRCELVSNINGNKVRGTVKSGANDGTYEISYCPIIKGRHQLHVVIDNQPIPGSPFSVLVEYTLQKLTNMVLSMKGAQRPWGLTVSEEDDEVVVTDNGRHCISIFSRTVGGILRSFGKYGSGPGQFKSPRGVTMDRNSHMYVVDSENHRIQKFTLDGKFIGAVGSMGKGPLEFYFPKDIAYNSVSDKLYILDGNNQIQIVNTDFSLCGLFGSLGRKEGQFDNPWGITCDKVGNVYVADTYNHRVQVFSADKEFITMFGSRGKEDGQLIDPICITVHSSKDMIYITERKRERVSIFSTEGKFIASSNGGGEKYGLSIDNDGLVYVCNMSKGQVQVF